MTNLLSTKQRSHTSTSKDQDDIGTYGPESGIIIMETIMYQNPGIYTLKPEKYNFSDQIEVGMFCPAYKHELSETVTINTCQRIFHIIVRDDDTLSSFQCDTKEVMHKTSDWYKNATFYVRVPKRLSNVPKKEIRLGNVQCAILFILFAWVWVFALLY